MPKKNTTNKSITIGLITIIIIAAIILLYVNLPQTENGIQKNEIVLSLIYGDQQINYTIAELELLEPYTGIGGFINRLNKTFGPNEYIGVTISYLLEQITIIPDNYSVIITASDGWETPFDIDEIQGNVEIYNEKGAKEGTGDTTMIIAYMENGEYITNPDEGPIRVTYVDDYYTSSSLWTRMVVSIEIIEEQ